ncbi:SDR family NAD(P)-dependent oxidoreductase [Cognatiluteimonas profundi]|uniref:SDR family NAD(P)-dependent oxidoreductase n=1 Tax=Cognatiluteimonas profundi TaxID=2594501 RepID=UPI0018EEFBC5|nr:SDR family NAD(P)-dependent oxidoreductase [Lysobacter profundi]
MSAATADTDGDIAATPLHGRVVLVTGAHGGLGQAASVACAKAGATVVLLGRKVPRLNRLHDRIASDGGEALLYPLDLEGASPDDYAELATRVESELGHLDGVLHCAAQFRGLTPLLHTDPAAFARAIHVNLTAPWWLTQACLPLLAKSADAAVVFTRNDLAQTRQAFWGGYGVAQHGLDALVAILHAELANGPIRVSALQPGPMRTGLRAMAYVEEDDLLARDPALYADACVTLLSAAGIDRRGQVWNLTP